MEHHNYSMARPIINQLLETLDGKWEEKSYCQDSLASIGFETLDGKLIYIYVPNALKCTPHLEEYSIFHVSVFDEYYPTYNTIDEVIEAFKGGVSEFYDSLEAIEREGATWNVE